LENITSSIITIKGNLLVSIFYYISVNSITMYDLYIKEQAFS